MSSSFFHSVKFDINACQGCVACIKFCPTEAIRIRDGKAVINETRCIDCGECIRICPYNAKSAYADKLVDIEKVKFNVALPDMSLFGHFGQDVSVGKVLGALKKIGFDAIYEVAFAAENIALEIEDYILTTPNLPKPMISSLCPAISRLVQVKFPELLKNIMPTISPLEVAARQAKEKYMRETGLEAHEIGIWGIVSCPAKVTAIRQPIDILKSDITGALSISEVYGEITKVISSILPDEFEKQESTSYGLNMGCVGGEVRATGLVNSLVVDDVKDVIDLLEQIEINKLYDLDYVECWSCPGGCVGGALNAENHFVSEKNLNSEIRLLKETEPENRRLCITKGEDVIKSNYETRYIKLMPRPVLKLDDDVVVAMKKFIEMKKIISDLPGLDCGACGSPSCGSLAEDIVRGLAKETDCIFKLKQLVGTLKEEVEELSGKETVFDKESFDKE